MDTWAVKFVVCLLVQQLTVCWLFGSCSICSSCIARLPAALATSTAAILPEILRLAEASPEPEAVAAASKLALPPTLCAGQEATAVTIVKMFVATQLSLAVCRPFAQQSSCLCGLYLLCAGGCLVMPFLQSLFPTASAAFLVAPSKWRCILQVSCACRGTMLLLAGGR